jgi:hypothetical protein
MIELLFAITAVSLVGATVAAGMAWRVVRENRRRSAARVARLADVIYASEPAEGTSVAVPHLLEPVTLPTGASRGRVVAAAVLALTAVLAAFGVTRVVGRAGTHAPGAARPRQDTTMSSPARSRSSTATLELVSLVHERGSGGQLELRGEVHDPANGATLEGVTAVAMLFDRQGAYLASGRAPLDVERAAPGGTATFAITIPDAAGAERYRVSFRTHDHIIPHTDRRGEH